MRGLLDRKVTALVCVRAASADRDAEQPCDKTGEEIRGHGSISTASRAFEHATLIDAAASIRSNGTIAAIHESPAQELIARSRELSTRIHRAQRRALVIGDARVVREIDGGHLLTIG